MRSCIHFLQLLRAAGRYVPAVLCLEYFPFALISIDMAGSICTDYSTGQISIQYPSGSLIKYKPMSGFSKHTQSISL